VGFRGDVLGSKVHHGVDFNLFLTVARSFAAENVEYKVVGGVALNVHGIARGTRDIDVFVAPDANNIMRLKRALKRVWDDPEIDGISEDDLLGDYPAVQYGPPDGDMSLDILTRLGEAFSYDDFEAETVDVEGVPVRVATPRMLYRMKCDTVRPIDKADAAALIDRFHLEAE
jgi:hypothetical protein